jgi:hypothetical protein
MSGRRYSTPISYVREDDVVWVTTGDRWWRNLLGGAPVGVCIAGRWREGIGAPVTDPRESHAVHDRLFRAHGWFRWLSGIPGDRTGSPDPRAIDRAVDAGRVAVRIKLI